MRRRLCRLIIQKCCRGFFVVVLASLKTCSAAVISISKATCFLSICSFTYHLCSNEAVGVYFSNLSVSLVGTSSSPDSSVKRSSRSHVRPGNFRCWPVAYCRTSLRLRVIILPRREIASTSSLVSDTFVCSCFRIAWAKEKMTISLSSMVRDICGNRAFFLRRYRTRIINGCACINAVISWLSAAGQTEHYTCAEVKQSLCTGNLCSLLGGRQSCTMEQQHKSATQRDDAINT